MALAVLTTGQTKNRTNVCLVWDIGNLKIGNVHREEVKWGRRGPGTALLGNCYRVSPTSGSGRQVGGLVAYKQTGVDPPAVAGSSRQFVSVMFDDI